MDNNFQNDNIEVLDVENIEPIQPTNTVSINMGDKEVNSTINPNAYHPGLNNNQNQVQNNSQTINQTENNAINNSAPSSVNKFEDDSNYEEVKDNKIMYIILAVAYGILTVSFYGLILIILFVEGISFLFLGPSDAFSTLGDIFSEMWWIMLVIFILRIPLKYQMKKYNTSLREIIGNSTLNIISVIFDIICGLFNRRR